MSFGSRRERLARSAAAAVAVAVALSGCVAAAPSGDGSWPAPSNGARLVALEESHDFGTVESGPIVQHRFRLKNVGTETVYVGSVSAPCGCTAVLASSQYLAPGEEGGVEVALDTYRLSGEQSKTVVVRSNDAIRPDLTLTLHGSVATDVSAAPRRLYLGRLPAGAVVSRHVDVLVKRPDVRITGVRAESNRFLVETSPLDDGSGLRLRVTLLPSAPAGTFDDVVVVSSDSPRQPELKIPVLGTLESYGAYARHGGDYGAP
jgi:hypothetical protein